MLGLCVPPWPGWLCPACAGRLRLLRAGKATRMSPRDEHEPAAGESGEDADRPVEDGSTEDETSAESFPSSDPPASYAGPDLPAD